MHIWHLARFSVVDHIRSSKLLVEALLIGLFLFFFWDHPQRMMREDFFLTNGLFLILLAGLESYQLLGRATDRRFHLVLSHVGPRRTVLGGLFLGVAMILSVVMLVLVLAGLLFTSVLQDTTWADYLGGLVLLILNLLTTMALCFLFSPFAAGSSLGWVSLALIVFGCSRNFFLLPPGSGIGAGVFPFLHKLLPPFYETLNAAEGHTHIAVPVLAGLHQLLYGAVVLGLAWSLCPRRELEPVD